MAFNSKVSSILQETLNTTIGDADSPETSLLPSTFNNLSPATVLHPNLRHCRLRSSGVNETPFQSATTLSTLVLPSLARKQFLEVHDKDDVCGTKR
jgi:hypothetical protein